MSCLPLMLAAQDRRPAIRAADMPRRAGTWEIGLGGGAMVLDHALRDYLMSGKLGVGFYHNVTMATAASVVSVASPGMPGGATPQVRIRGREYLNFVVPSAELRIGYNLTNHLGLSVSGAQAMSGGVTSIFVGPAVTWTMNLDRGTRPFVLAGSDFQRISGANGETLNANWGGHVGIGMRQMLTEQTALRVEARLRVSKFEDVPTPSGITYSPALMIGVSHFMGGGRGTP